MGETHQKSIQMPQYRRHYQKEGSYFFTVVTYKRVQIFEDIDAVNLLRECFRTVMADHPFKIDAIAVLPDHLHCLWSLPDNDYDFSTRWKEIKSRFTNRYIEGSIKTTLKPTLSMSKKGEKGIWQRRFWEHAIRNERDYAMHCDYIHYNPVKHGLVKNPVDWPYSSFKRFVENELYPSNWAAEPPHFPEGIGGE